MRTTSALWSKIAARGQFNCEAKLVIGNTTYTEITAPKVTRIAMQEGISIGNCCTACLNVSIYTTDTIAKGAQVNLYGRIFNEKGTSEWLCFGVFFISKRSYTDTMINLTCYDSMLKAETSFKSSDHTSYGDKRSFWQTLAWIADEMSVGIHPDTQAFFEAHAHPIDPDTSPYAVPFPEAGTTYREILEDMAGIMGGNFVITEDNQIKLVLLKSAPDESFDIISNDYEEIVTSEGDNLVYDENPVTYPDTDNVFSIPAVLGSIQVGERGRITGVTYTTSNQNGRTFSEGGNTGFVLYIEDNQFVYNYSEPTFFYNLDHEVLHGWDTWYEPFIATRCVFNPALEMGDRIKIGDRVFSVIYNYSFTLGNLFTADISAPFLDEDEYPYNASVVSAKTATSLQVRQRRSNNSTYYVAKGTVGMKNSSGDMQVTSTGDIEFQTANNTTTLDSIISRISALENR